MRPSLRARLAAVLLAGVLVTSVSSPALAAGQAGPKQERRLLALVNHARAKHGLRPLKMGARMRKKARTHSFQMAQRNALFHTGCLPCVSPKPYRSLAENVGYAGTVRQVHRLFMKSSGHRRNILCSCFRKTGLGVVRRGGWFWVTERFWG